MNEFLCFLSIAYAQEILLKYLLVYLNRNVARNVLLCYSSMRCVGNIEIAIYLDNQFFSTIQQRQVLYNQVMYKKDDDKDDLFS